MFRGYCLPKSSIPSCKRFLKNADFLFTDWLCSIASLVSPRNTEIQTTEKFSMVNYCHTQHLGLKSVHIPGVFHPLLNTHDNHPSRYHFSTSTDEKTGSERLFQNYTDSNWVAERDLQVRNFWLKSSSHHFPNTKREGRRKGDEEINFIIY